MSVTEVENWIANYIKPRKAPSLLKNPVELNFEQACMALEGTIDRVNGKPHLKWVFPELDHIPAYAGTGKGVSVRELSGALKNWDAPVPSTLLEKLDLAPGSTVDDVAAAFHALYAAPLVMTPGEEAEQEMFFLKISEAIEKMNADDPDGPQGSVLYPHRTKQ